MAKYKPSKNKKKHIVKKIQETEGLNTGFGDYEESTGGGKPFEAGNSNTRTTRENGKTRQANNPTTNQPRTEDGKFTYKSVNGKSIDPKYGPSRGVTVPPTLTGGQNGIKIEDVEKEFGAKSGAYWDKYKDHWYNVGGKIVTIGLSTKISAKAIWDMAKEYDSSLGEYKGESENWKTKAGVKSKAEKEAIGKAKSEKAQQNVIAKEGGIEQVGGSKKKAIQDFVKSKKEPEEVKEEVTEEATKEEPVVNEEEKQPWGKSGKFTLGDKNKAVGRIKQELGSEYDEEFWTDEMLEEFIESNPSILE